jgi:hypothetical protein
VVDVIDVGLDDEPPADLRLICKLEARFRVVQSERFDGRVPDYRVSDREAEPILGPPWDRARQHQTAAKIARNRLCLIIRDAAPEPEAEVRKDIQRRFVGHVCAMVVSL